MNIFMAENKSSVIWLLKCYQLKNCSLRIILNSVDIDCHTTNIQFDKSIILSMVCFCSLRMILNSVDIDCHTANIQYDKLIILIACLCQCLIRMKETGRLSSCSLHLKSLMLV